MVLNGVWMGRKEGRKRRNDVFLPDVFVLTFFVFDFSDLDGTMKGHTGWGILLLELSMIE